MKKLILPLCFLAGTSFGSLKAYISDNLSLREQLFNQGKVMYEIKSWDACLDKLFLFKELSGQEIIRGKKDLVPADTDNKTPINDDLMSEADFMIAVSEYEKGKSDAPQLFNAYIAAYPNSIYADEARYYIGDYYFYKKDYYQAADWYETADIERLPLDKQPLLMLHLGVSYLNMGNMESAKPVFKVLESLGGGNTEAAIYYKAYIDYYEKRYDNALRGFSSLPKNSEYSLTGDFYITQIEFMKGRDDAALRTALSLLQKNTTNEQAAELNMIAGSIYYKEGNYLKAYSHFEKYFELSEKPERNAALMGGLSAYNTGKFDQAINMLSNAVKEDDLITQQAYLFMGHSCLKSEDKRNALIFFEHAAKMNTDLSLQEDAMYNYGLLIHTGSYSPFNESVTVFQEFLNKYPNSSYRDRVSDCLVESFMTTRSYGAALDAINKISKPDTKLLAAKQRLLFQLGTQSFADNKPEEAKQYFTQAINLGNLDYENRAQAYFWRGETYYREGDYKAAENDFKQFLNLTTSRAAEIYALGRYNLAYAMFQQNNFNDAIDSFNKYVAIPSEKGKDTYIDAYNRIGDCFFYKRQFKNAEDAYTEVVNAKGIGAEYALFQRGYMAGLQKNYNLKTAIMANFVSTYPDSEYADDALFEQGKTYMLTGNKQKAKESFKRVTDSYPNSPLARQAGLNLALAYFNDNQNQEAIEAYKKIIDNYPGSDEAKIAAEDLKAVYVEINDINAYAGYIKTLNGKVILGEGEQDSLSYFAAEKVLAKGNPAESKAALQKYVDSYMNGAFKLNAYTELGRIYFVEKNYPKSIEAYENVIEYPDNKFTVEALQRVGSIYYSMDDVNNALKYYEPLSQKATAKDVKKEAVSRIMVCQFINENYNAAIEASSAMAALGSLTKPEETDVYYYRAKSYLALNEDVKAVEDLEKLAADTRNEKGAEAAYLLGAYYFANNNYDQAEKQAFKMIDSATPHQYWLARTFILLSDVYAAKGDNFQAKQYLQSLKNNYSGKDNISEMIEERFQKLGE